MYKYGSGKQDTLRSIFCYKHLSYDIDKGEKYIYHKDISGMPWTFGQAPTSPHYTLYLKLPSKTYHHRSTKECLSARTWACFVLLDLRLKAFRICKPLKRIDK